MAESGYLTPIPGSAIILQLDMRRVVHYKNGLFEADAAHCQAMG